MILKSSFSKLLWQNTAASIHFISTLMPVTFYLPNLHFSFFKVWLVHRSVVIQFEKYFDNSKHENWGRLFGSIPTLIVLSVSISRHTTTSVSFYWQSHVKFFENISFSPFFRRENKQFSRCVGIVTATANINVGRVQLLAR